MDSGGVFGQGEICELWFLREVVLLTEGNDMDNDMRETTGLFPILTSQY